MRVRTRLNRDVGDVGRNARFPSTHFVTTPFNISPAHWARVSALFDEAIDLDAPARNAMLATLRESSPELADELEALLTDARRAALAPSRHPAQVAPFTMLLNAALADDAMIHSPKDRFGAWSLEEKIGSGGMGEVWRAKRSDGLFEGFAAIKLLRSDLAASKLAARFARERSVLARLNHPNIARLLDAGVGGANNDQAFLVLELVEGLPLTEYVNTHAPHVADRVRLVRDVARAVDYAHSQLVLHRDIKPSNVLVTKTGDVKLLDFGIAAAIDEAATAETSPNLTQLTGRGLTLEYAAPEQIVGEPTVAASDTYSLGAMLFQLLTGAHPFAHSKNRMAMQNAAVNDEARRTSAAARESAKRGNNVPDKDAVRAPGDATRIDADLDAIVAKALRKSPSERYITAAALMQDLDAWLTQSPISIRAEDRRYRGTLWLKRNWKLASLGAIAASAIVIGLGVSLWQRNEAVKSAVIAKDEAARSEKVSAYLGELIESASPDNHAGNWPTVIALLEKSEKELESRFKDDPKTHALLLKRMLDTNDALNRDTVAQKQSQQLIALLETIEPINQELLVDAMRQQGWLLYRLNRFPEALAVYEKLKPKLVAFYGTQHRDYAKYLLGLGGVLKELGRYDETLTLYDEGYALLMKLEPNNSLHRLDRANDKTVFFTRQNRWKDAESELSAVENTFEEAEKTSGAALRDVLIMRNNLEAIRIRIGKYEGVETRLQKSVAAGEQLLGRDNMISIRALGLLASLACDAGAFERCLTHLRSQRDAMKRRVGGEPSEVIESEIRVVSMALLIEQTPKATAREALRKLIDGASNALGEAGTQRAYIYRLAADAALRADDLSLARDALSRARNDLIAIKAPPPERVAQMDRTEAALAFRSGDARRAVELLSARFAINEANKETDTPQHGALWLQRAIYELEFDRTAAAGSLAASRSAFERAGGAMPHFQALLVYVEAKISGDPNRARDAQAVIDRIYLRKTSPTWTVPSLQNT